MNREIDWEKLALKLRSAGWDSNKVFCATGINYQHFNRLATGATYEPRFNSGLKLIKIARESLTDSEFEECVKRPTLKDSDMATMAVRIDTMYKFMDFIRENRILSKKKQTDVNVFIKHLMGEI